MSGRAAEPEQTTLPVVLEQIAPELGSPEANGARIRELTEAANAGLVVFPELSLTGYDLRGRAPGTAVRRGRAPVPGLAEPGPAVAVGYVEEAPDHRLFNAAAVQRGERIVAVHRKVHLPTYGMFDEGRHFAPGLEPSRCFRLAPGWRAGLLVCEDLWHPALPYLLAMDGADVLLVLAAAPGRGSPEAPESERLFGSSERWSLLARTTAFVHGVYVLLCNRVGVEGGVTFAGRSLVVAPDGTVLAEGAEDREDRLEAVLDRERLRAARRPFSHLRDEDPAVVRRALARLEGDGGGDR